MAFLTGLQRRPLIGDIAKLKALTKTAAKPTGMKIIYTGPMTGAGHMSPAKNLAAAAKERGVDAELVEFEPTFGNPGEVRQFSNKYRDFVQGKNDSFTGVGKAYLKSHIFGPNQERIKKYVEANKDKAIVLTNTTLQAPFIQADHPVHVLHTDPVNWPMDYDYPSVKGKRIHVGTREVLKSLGARHKETLTGLPVHPKVTRKQKRSGLMDRKTFNLTVSGGGMGAEVPEMVERVLRSDLPSNARIHAVAGKNPGILKKLQRMSKKDSRLVAHGFAPLPSMMQEADINVIRSHGTTFAETQASGKPAVYYAPDPEMTDLQGKLTKGTAEFGGRTVGNPTAIGLENIPEAVGTAVKRHSTLLRRSRRAQQRFGNPSDQAVRKIMRARPEYEKTAYHDSNHKRLTGNAVKEMGKGVSTEVKRLVVKGSHDSDYGIRGPWFMVNDPVHAFPNMRKTDAFKEVEKVKGRGVAAVAAAMAGKGTARDAVGGLLDIGQGSHTLADISAHMEKPVAKGESVVRAVGNFFPDGFGGSIPSLVEHLQSKRRIDSLSTKNPIDQLAVKRQKGYGKAVRKDLMATLQGAHGMNKREARKQYKQFMETFTPTRADETLGHVARNTKYVGEQIGRAAAAYRKSQIHGFDKG